MSSTLPISKIAWPNSWLNIMFSFARCPRTNFFRTNFDSFNRFCIRLYDFFFHSFPSTSIFEVVCPSVLVAKSASVEWSVTSCALAWSSLFNPLFPEAGFICLRSGMLLLQLLALPILFQRYLECRPWSFKAFEIYSMSVLRGHTINAISRYRSVSHDCE